MIQLQFTVSLVILVPVLHVCSDGRKDNLTAIHFTDKIRLAYASAPIDGDKLRFLGLVQALECEFMYFLCLKISENEKIFLNFADF